MKKPKRKPKPKPKIRPDVSWEPPQGGLATIGGKKADTAWAPGYKRRRNRE